MDVDTAFLNASICKDIWVKVPDGTPLAPGDTGVYKLREALHGYKQAPRSIASKWLYIGKRNCLFVNCMNILISSFANMSYTFLSINFARNVTADILRVFVCHMHVLFGRVSVSQIKQFIHYLYIMLNSISSSNSGQNTFLKNR